MLRTSSMHRVLQVMKFNPEQNFSQLPNHSHVWGLTLLLRWKGYCCVECGAVSFGKYIYLCFSEKWTSMSKSEDGDSTCLRNVGYRVPNYTSPRVWRREGHHNVKCNTKEKVSESRIAENYSVEDHKTQLHMMCSVMKTTFAPNMSYDFTVVYLWM
jgi:hypothetical protein